jgi:plastocyanin
VAVRAGDTLSLSTTYDTRRASWYESMGLAVVWMYDGPGGNDPFSTKIDQKGVLTHGHLPENDNHGGKSTTAFADARESGSGPLLSTIPIGSFEYGAGDLAAKGKVPTVTEGQQITFDNFDAGDQNVWHSITACKAPCTGTTGIAYPLADADVQFDSGQLGTGGAPTSGSTTWSTPADLTPGTYTYFCRVHPFMRGAFRVVPPASNQRASAPKYLAITNASARTCAGLPSAITRPASRQYTRSLTDITSGMSCSMSSTAASRSRWMSRKRGANASVSCCERPAVGSSRRTTRAPSAS